MIKGLTHDDGGVPNMIIKYRGKISSGYAPNEGPNKKNYPIAAGFFRILKEVVTTKRLPNSQDVVAQKKWIENEVVQKKLIEANGGSNTPRKIEIVCLHKTKDEMWESALAMYSKSEGLMCKSYGKGTNAKYLEFTSDGDRKWIDRTFNGKPGCLYDECPDYKDKKCKPIGLLKCFPVIDCTPNPYRFETRSINTILGIESALDQYSNLLRVAHHVKQREADKELPFDGFFGTTFNLVHRKAKSGGREIYISDLLPTDEFTNITMEPIKRGLEFQVSQAKIAGGGGSASLLYNAGQKLLQDTTDEEPVPLDIDDQRDIAVQFDSSEEIDGVTEDTGDNKNSEPEPSKDIRQDVTEKLMNKEN